MPSIRAAILMRSSVGVGVKGVGTRRVQEIRASLYRAGQTQHVQISQWPQAALAYLCALEGAGNFLWSVGTSNTSRIQLLSIQCGMNSRPKCSLTFESTQMTMNTVSLTVRSAAAPLHFIAWPQEWASTTTFDRSRAGYELGAPN